MLSLLGRPGFYLAWQRTHARGKLDLLHDELNLRAGETVLDLGCGPGTNTVLFPPPGYLGVDISPEYIGHARRAFPQHRFEIHDLRESCPEGGPFDLVLANSLFHHLSLDTTERVLSAVARGLAPGGRVVVLELTMPSRGLKRLAAQLDRGQYVRPYAAWTRLFERHFEVADTRLFELRLCRTVPLWDMAFYRLSAKSA